MADKQTWHGKTEVRYWRQKIYKPTYLRGGQRVEAKHWAMHLQRNGIRTSLTLDTPIREAAATKAREVYLFLKVHPWEEMMARFKPNRAEKKTTAAGMTVGEFIGAARSVAEMKAIVLESYVRCFRRIVADVARIARPRSRFDFKKGGRIAWLEEVDAVKLAKITPAKVQEWKKNYVADAKPDVKSQNRAKTSVNSALRSARCLFSQSNILDRLKDRMELPPSPFDGVRYEKRPVTKYASTINIESLIAAARTELAGTAPECFKVFLLGTFAGLRRKEIDLLEWSSFRWNENAIRIESTEFFEAKTNESHADVYIDTEVMEILRVIPTHSSVS